ncbi:MAG: hypothetical protein VB093_06195 [Propionicimonas sp.]|nr:hypothetical protein [Propionicimonas sp.]
MRNPRRLATLAVAGLGVLALAGVVTSSAATLGGALPAELGTATAQTQRITGATLDWAPVRSGADWTADDVTITTDPGQSFLADDLVKLTIDQGDDGSCQVSTAVTKAATAVTVGSSALRDACGTVAFDQIGSIALSITGDDLAATFTGSLGEVRGSLAAFTGALVDPDTSLRGSTSSATVDGVSYLTQLVVEVTSDELAPADLVGTRVLASLSSSSDGTSLDYAGTISLDSSAPVRVGAATGGTAAATVTLDLSALADQAGTARPRAAAVDHFAVVLSSPQHLGASLAGAAGDYAIAMAAGSIDSGSSSDGDSGSTVSSALDPVSLDNRLTYQYSSATTNFDNNSLAFCHSFSVTNTSSTAIDWTLTFNTSYVPLWGFDPTASGAFSSAWNWETVSYDSTTHLWTIRGTGQLRTLQPGATLNSFGFCVNNVPTPPVDPTTFSSALSLNGSSSQWYAALDLQVTSTSHWNVPWEITVDLGDYLCPAGLTDRQLTWSGGVEVASSQGTVYTLRGRVGQNTRFVADGRPVKIRTLVSYTPAGGRYLLPCSSALRVAAAASQPAAATTDPANSAAESTTDATVPAAESTPTATAMPQASPLPSADASPAAAAESTAAADATPAADPTQEDDA